LKKNKKSVPTEKKFWIISIAVGICLVVLSVCFFSNADKEKKEADLLDTVNYVKVQCSTYTHYNESSESKSLLRAIEGTRQVSKNIAAEIENEKTLDNQLLKESAEQLWLTGIAILDIDGNIVCEYSTNESLLPEIKECAKKEIVLDTAIYDEKVYAKRINHNDGAYIDMAACTRKDAPGVVVTYYYTSAEYATNYTLTIQRLLNGYRKDRDGTIIVADEGVIIASNNTRLIGQSTTDYEAIQKLKDHADSKHMMGLTINGVRCHGVMLKQSDYYIYAYVPDSIIFQTLLQNVIMCLFIYLVVVALIWMIYRKLQKNILKIEKEKEQKYQKSLLEAAEKADAANRAKTEFLQRMSHDIRTPINGICGMLDVGDYYRDDLSRQTECRGKIREASNILKELVNEVLDMSKLESGEIYLEEKPFNIYQIINEVIDVVGKMADEREIKVEHKTPEIIHKDLIGSPIHLKRLLMNILSNAVKYNKDYGKIYLSSREIPSDQDGVVMLEFICQDTGIGMSEEFQKHLFEPFAQEQKGGASKFGGTGLGMPITKSLVEKMGGTIIFISEQGIGTTFVITIPFKINEDVARDKEKQEEVTASIRGLNILLVEDNELNMEIAEFVIQSEGASVVKAWNGQEAVEAFEKSASGEFDAILMDVMMPVMNGYEATKMIRSMDRSDAKKIPIIAMTANAFVEDRIKSKEAGMNEHVSKPIDMKLLVKIIAELAGKNKNCEDKG